MSEDREDGSTRAPRGSRPIEHEALRVPVDDVPHVSASESFASSSSVPPPVGSDAPPVAAPTPRVPSLDTDALRTGSAVPPAPAVPKDLSEEVDIEVDEEAPEDEANSDPAIDVAVSDSPAARSGLDSDTVWVRRTLPVSDVPSAPEPAGVDSSVPGDGRADSQVDAQAHLASSVPAGDPERRDAHTAVTVPADAAPNGQGIESDADLSSPEIVIEEAAPEEFAQFDVDVDQDVDDASAGEEPSVAAALETSDELPPAVEIEARGDMTEPSIPVESDEGLESEDELEPESGPPPSKPTPAISAASIPAPVVGGELRDPDELGIEEDAPDAERDALHEARRPRPWFETFFNDDYLRTVRPPGAKHVVRQCDFISRVLGLKPGATILDVGCGLGLHAVELSARGYVVVGLDLSVPMLSRAADEAEDRGQKVNFLHADMREMSFDGRFDAVLCWGTTLGYFDDESNKQVISRLYRALKPKGLLLIDVVNRDYVMRNQPNLVWFEGDGCVCMEETQFNHIKSRLEVKRTVILDDGRQKESYYSIRLYSLHELGQLLHQKGFRVAAVSGHEATPGVFFGADSARMIILGERRPGRPSVEIEPPPPPTTTARHPTVPEGSPEEPSQ